MVKLRARNLDFIRAEKKKERKESGKQMVRGFLFLIPAALILFFLNTYNLRTGKIAEKTEQIQSLEAYLSSPEVMDVQKRLERLNEVQRKLRDYQGEADAAEYEIHSSFAPDSADIAAIEQAAGHTIQIIWKEDTPVRFEDGSLHVQAEGQQPKDASAFVKRLEDTNRFSEVTYGGIVRKEAEDKTKVSFRFSVSCRLKTSEAKDGSS